MNILHTLSTCKQYVSVSIIVLAMTLFLAGCPSPNDPAPNDSKPLLTITATQASVTEGATSTFTITRNNNEGALSVLLNISGSAEHNVDYTVDSTVNTDSSTGNKTMTVDFEDSNKSVTFTITAKNDQDTEANGETVEIEINESDDYTIGDHSTATLTIVDPSVVSISTSGSGSGENNINEDESIIVTITSNQQVPTNLDVILTIGGDATINEDYALRGVTTNTLGDTVTATVTIPSGDTEAMVTIEATDDSIRELDENLTITISDEPSTYRIKEGEKTVTVTITDDDLPTVSIAVDSVSISESSADDEVEVTLTRSNDDLRASLTVQLSFKDSTTATAGQDFEQIRTSITIPNTAASVNFKLNPLDDGAVEGDEKVIITISDITSAYTIDGVNNEVTITIIDDGNKDHDSTDDSFDVDDDNNGLIEIHNLDMLRNVHFNLAGTSYDNEEDDGSGNGGETNGGPDLQTDHCSTQVNEVYLCGYELTGNLDFSDAGSYATGIIQNDWRPHPDDATNEGFPGIGAKTGDSGGFTGIFEGNGYSISNLYMRNTTTQGYNTGLFRLTEAGAKIRNLGMMNVAIYGGDGNSDAVGGLVGYNYGTITASYATGDVDGGAGNSDSVGGLVGVNESAITASYGTGTVDGGDGNEDNVGGLVGLNNSGAITASYATGNVDGGAGDSDDIGGLVGYNLFASITASYATGTVDGGAGDSDDVGGLVGYNLFASITASYATGDVDGGTGDSDRVGGLVGNSNRPITASYGFGEATNVGTAGSAGTTKPTLTGDAFITKASELGSSTTATTAPADPSWNNAVSNTLGAWDFGNSDQNPALKYADYDGPGTTYSCDQFPATIPGTDTRLECGTTLLPGQR